tara:strand:- start:318 stop:560 length:243 start_codon:yes stop_codon:yes gene_type:complete
MSTFGYNIQCDNINCNSINGQAPNALADVVLTGSTSIGSHDTAEKTKISIKNLPTESATHGAEAVYVHTAADGKKYLVIG